MKGQGGGKIVNIASGTFFAGVPLEAHYVASKGAIIGFTRAISRELGQYNITVNALASGFTLTEAAKANTPEEDYKNALIQTRSLKRSEVPDDLVGTMIFLCCPDSNFMTGQTVLVDGGRALN
ncbi:MAG: SDR family NAD(P)-dependent oxidoreductase, partial [Rhabdochlamydiaceae bacterium]